MLTLGIRNHFACIAFLSAVTLCPAPPAAAQPRPDNGGSSQVAYVAKLQPPQNPDAPDKTNPQQQQPAPQKPSRHKVDLYPGLDAGVVLPTSGKTRSRFGSSWFSFGPTIGSISVPRLKGRLSPDISFISQSKNDDYVFFALLGVEYRRSLLTRERSIPAAPKDDKAPDKARQTVQKSAEIAPRPRFVPYAGVSADLAVGDLRSIEDNVHSGVRTGAAGSAFLGLDYRNRAFVEARYMQTSVLKGFDLSSFSLTAGYRFKISL